MNRLIIFLLSLTTFLLPARAQREYKIETDIPYRESGADEYAAARCRLDIYHPTDAKDCSTIVWFHGGGLTGGNKFIPQELKDCGYVVVAVNYRLLPKVDINTCVDDAAAAVAWTMRHIHEYGGAADKIYVAGHSAGGYLTAMIGLDKRRLDKYNVDADSLAGLFSFSGHAICHFNYREAKGMKPYQPLIDETAPIYYVRPDAPLFVIVSGDREMELYGRYEENAYFWRMMKLAGHEETYLYELQGYNHGDMAAPAFHILKTFVNKRNS
jgi:acetyl esterase/lipase